MTKHFFVLFGNDNAVVVMIKCFAPLHGHVQVAQPFLCPCVYDHDCMDHESEIN